MRFRSPSDSTSADWTVVAKGLKLKHDSTQMLNLHLGNRNFVRLLIASFEYWRHVKGASGRVLARRDERKSA